MSTLPETTSTIDAAAWNIHQDAVDIIASLRLIAKTCSKSELEDEDFSSLPYMVLVDCLADRLQKSADTLESVLSDLSRQKKTDTQAAATPT